MSFILLNSDNTVNFITDEWDDNLDTNGIEVLEFKDKTAVELQNNIPPMFCIFDKKAQKVKDVRKNPELLLQNMSKSEKERFQREVRKRKLSQVDAVVSNPLRYGSMSETEVEEVINYRQALLDITEQSGFPTKVKWPEKPKFME